MSGPSSLRSPAGLDLLPRQGSGGAIGIVDHSQTWLSSPFCRTAHSCLVPQEVTEEVPKKFNGKFTKEFNKKSNGKFTKKYR